MGSLTLVDPSTPKRDLLLHCISLANSRLSYSITRVYTGSLHVQIVVSNATYQRTRHSTREVRKDCSGDTFPPISLGEAEDMQARNAQAIDYLWSRA